MDHLLYAVFPLAFNDVNIISTSLCKRSFPVLKSILKLSLVYLTVWVDADALPVALAAKPAAVVLAGRGNFLPYTVLFTTFPLAFIYITLILRTQSPVSVALIIEPFAAVCLV